MSRGTVALAVLAGGMWSVLPGATAHAGSTYDGFARANGFDVVINNQSIPTGIDIQGVGPEAEVHQTSYGIGDASSQMPYAGNTVPGLPGTAAALFGLPVPPWPFIASSTQGGDPQTVSYPGMVLHAESRDYLTLASAMAVSDASGATSTARVDSSKDDSITSSAVTEASALKIGNVATLSGVKTEAVVVADGFSGQLTRTTHTSIAHISVPGMVLTIPEQTPSQVGVPVPIPGVPNLPPVPLPPMDVPMGGTQIQNPDIGIQDGYFTLTMPVGPGSQKVAVPAGPVLDALKGAGITVTFQAPEKLAKGITSGTYKFTYTIPAPPNNNYYTGPTKVTQTTGLATATADLTPVFANDGGGAFNGSTGSFGVPGTGLAGTPGGLQGATSPLGPGEAAFGTAPAPAPQVSAPDTPGPHLSVAGFRVGVGVGNLYLALVVIALLGFVSSTAMRLMGVRFLWTS